MIAIPPTANDATPHGANGNGAPLDDVNRCGRRIQELVEKIEALDDTEARDLMRECLESVLAFYGQGLERVLRVLGRCGQAGEKVRDEMLCDKVFTGLLLIHGLHPVDLKTRLNEALEKVRPYMKSHGGDVELLSLEDDFARLRLQGSCESCPSSSVTLELAVRNAIEEACPDLQGFEVEGAAPHPGEAPRAEPQWVTVANAADLRDSEFRAVAAAGIPLILCRLGDDLFAYRDRCPACNLPLHLGGLETGALSCRAGHRFGVRDAGRSLDGGVAHLDPFPLLVKEDSVQVAVAPKQGGNP